MGEDSKGRFGGRNRVLGRREEEGSPQARLAALTLGPGGLWVSWAHGANHQCGAVMLVGEWCFVLLSLLKCCFQMRGLSFVRKKESQG